MYEVQRDITREFILSRVTEIDIFEKYICPVEFGVIFCSPLRLDNSPTCSFYWDNSNRLILKDFSGQFYGDCFEAIKLTYRLTFRQVLDRIALDFNLLEDVVKTDKESTLIKPEIEKESQVPINIQVERQKWTDVDKEFWKSFGYNSKLLEKYEISSVRTAWINDNIVYRWKADDPCYVYYFGRKRFKLYFPFRKNWRFLQNTNCLQGFNQLPETGEVLIITKSLKDVGCFDLFDIPAVAPASESSILTITQYNELSSRFKNIYSNFDFDRAGCRTAFKMWRQYGIPCLFFTNGRYGTEDFRAKDLSDFIKRFGLESTKLLIEHTKTLIL